MFGLDNKVLIDKWDWEDMEDRVDTLERQLRGLMIHLKVRAPYHGAAHIEPEVKEKKGK